MSMNPLAHTLLAPIFRDARDMMLLTWAGVRAPSLAALDTAAALGRGIHKAEKDLTERLVTEPAETASLRLVPAHVERIGDSIEGLIRCCQEMAAEGTVFTSRGWRDTWRSRAFASRTWPTNMRGLMKSGWWRASAAPPLPAPFWPSWTTCARSRATPASSPAASRSAPLRARALSRVSEPPAGNLCPRRALLKGGEVSA